MGDFDYTPTRPELAATCILHDDENIVGFFERYRFLSNFWPAKILMDGYFYPTVENAYQAAKSTDIDVRITFINMKPQDAKKEGRSIQIRSNWEKLKVYTMHSLLLQKFNPLMNPQLSVLLYKTGKIHLEECNYWDDMFWGTNTKRLGFNNLGRLLMSVRNTYKESESVPASSATNT